MNSLKRSKAMTYMALAALAIALGSGLANAQELVETKGEFNLPFTARWGRMTLAPGQYSFAMTRSMGGAPLITVERGINVVGMVPANEEGNRQPSEPSHLTAVRAAGAYRVISLDLSALGIELRFAAPKQELLEASQTTRNVPVLLASK